MLTVPTNPSVSSGAMDKNLLNISDVMDSNTVDSSALTVSVLTMEFSKATSPNHWPALQVPSNTLLPSDVTQASETDPDTTI
jgi:hypothetical protein